MSEVSERGPQVGSPLGVPRPLPPRRFSDHARAWMTWFGIPRMLALGVTVLFVGAGGYWLLHAPPPPAEASLPFAATMSTQMSSPLATAPSAASSTSSVPTATRASLDQSPAFVHVAGAANAPGVYQLPPGSRVIDAIEVAGGPAPDASLDGLNLAAPVADGQRVYVPVVGEVDPASVDNGPTSPTSAGGGESPPGGGSPPDIVDLNRATATELETLPGIGPATAVAIIDDRERNGPFAAVDDLDRVSGIGPATLEALRNLVTV